MRPRNIAGVALIATALAIAMVSYRWRTPDGPSERPVVAITGFTTIGDAIEPWSGRGLAHVLEEQLRTVPDVAMGPMGDASGADYLLGGTLSRREGRTEVGVQVLRASDRAVVWSGTYWREQGDLESFEREIADAVLVAVRRDGGPKPR